MEFCPKCNSLIIPRNVDGKLIGRCGNCGFLESQSEELVAGEEVEHNKVKEGVVGGKNAAADYKHKCSKCGYDKAQIIELGVFYSDEDNLILLKCGQCGFSERIGRAT